MCIDELEDWRNAQKGGTQARDDSLLSGAGGVYLVGCEMSKYKAVPTVVDGVRFASKREAARYQELKLLQKAGKIDLLQLQPKFKLLVSGIHVADYVGDFKYYDRVMDEFVVEDVKGVKTPVYRLKKKLMKAIHGIEIREV